MSQLFLANTSVEAQFFDSGGKRVQSPIRSHSAECGGSLSLSPHTIVWHTKEGITWYALCQRDALVLVTPTHPLPYFCLLSLIAFALPRPWFLWCFRTLFPFMPERIEENDHD